MDSAMQRINIVRSTVKVEIATIDDHVLWLLFNFLLNSNEWIYMNCLNVFGSQCSHCSHWSYLNERHHTGISINHRQWLHNVHVRSSIIAHLHDEDNVNDAMNKTTNENKNTANQERCCNNNACRLNDVYSASQNKIHDWAAKMKQMNKKKLHQITIDCNRSHISKLILSYAHEHNRSIACTLSSYAHTRFRVFPIHWQTIHGSVWARMIYGFTICKL